MEILTQKIIHPNKPRPVLSQFSNEDDIEHFLIAFERNAIQQEWHKNTWCTQLAGLLSGKALSAYCSVDPSLSCNYTRETGFVTVGKNVTYTESSCVCSILSFFHLLLQPKLVRLE